MQEKVEKVKVDAQEKLSQTKQLIEPLKVGVTNVRQALGAPPPPNSKPSGSKTVRT